MERTGLHAAGPEMAQAVAHLTRGTRRERHREHPMRRIDAGADAVRHPVRDRPGLAGARSGEHADRAAQRLGDRALLGIEPGEHVEGISGRCGLGCEVGNSGNAGAGHRVILAAGCDSVVSRQLPARECS